MTIRIERRTGADTAEILDRVAALRIEVFREYPYLYEGDLSYEQVYLRALAAAERAVIVCAIEGGEVVGAATGAPLVTQVEEFRAPLESAGLRAEEVFYFGESVLLAPWRGRGIGHAFFDEREGHAREIDGIRHCSFCGVVRPEDHPARPADHRPLDGFWRGRGYTPLPGAIGSFSWKELGDSAETPHPMQFWLRTL